MSATTATEVLEAIPDQADPPPYFVTPKGSSHVAFHSDRDCIRIMAPEKVQQRSARYVVWHDLTPCVYCHDAPTHPSTKAAADPLEGDDDA